MGEMAEGLLDGTFCEGCGEVFDDIIEGADPPGHPRRHPGCEADEGGHRIEEPSND